MNDSGIGEQIEYSSVSWERDSEICCICLKNNAVDRQCVENEIGIIVQI